MPRVRDPPLAEPGAHAHARPHRRRGLHRGAAHLAADVLSLVCLVPLVTIHGPAVAAALGCREHADFEAAADEDEAGEVGADAWCDAHGGIHAYAALAEAGPAETLVHLLAATVCVCLLVQVSARLARRLVGALGLSLPVCCLVAYRKGDHPRVERRNSVGLGTGAKPTAALLPSDLGIVALDPPRCACGFFAPPLALALAEALVGVYVLAWLAPEFDDDGAGAAARAAELAHAVVELPPSDSATLVCAVALFCLAAARIAVPPAAATLAAAWRVVTRCLGSMWAQLAAFGAMVAGLELGWPIMTSWMEENLKYFTTMEGRTAMLAFAGSLAWCAHPPPQRRRHRSPTRDSKPHPPPARAPQGLWERGVVRGAAHVRERAVQRQLRPHRPLGREWRPHALRRRRRRRGRG